MPPTRTIFEIAQSIVENPSELTQTSMEEIINAGAHNSLVATMKAHTNNINVAVPALGAVMSLSKSTIGIHSLMVADAPKTIIQVMVAHPDSAKVAEFGCEALLNIASLSCLGRQMCEAVGAPAMFRSSMLKFPDVMAKLDRQVNN